jgi:hypothetical protein
MKEKYKVVYTLTLDNGTKVEELLNKQYSLGYRLVQTYMNGRNPHFILELQEEEVVKTLPTMPPKESLPKEVSPKGLTTKEEPIKQQPKKVK